MKKRLANFECLRVIAMFMVVALHYLAHSDALLTLDLPLNLYHLTATLLESFCIVAVNVYLLITGYFMTEADFKVSRIVQLVCQLLFYSLLIPVILMLCNIPIAGAGQGIYGLLSYLLPVETDHYWFASSYVMLYLLLPFFNPAIRAMSQKQLQLAMGGLLILFCGIKSICPAVLSFDRYGYDLPWFICVYLVAAYIRRFGISFLERGRRALMVYLSSCLLIFGISLAAWAVYGRTQSMGYYFTVPYHYNFIFCLTGAIGLFYLAKRWTIKAEPLANFLCFAGPLSFGVYLFHEHIDIRDRWLQVTRQITGAFLGFDGTENILLFFLHMIIAVAAIFIIGIGIDWMRSRLFVLCGRWIGRTAVGRWFMRMDQLFSRK